MFTIYGLYDRVKHSVFDKALESLQDELNYKFIPEIFENIGKINIEVPALIIVRSSELKTSSLECKQLIYPKEIDRKRSKDKWKLYKYCLLNKINTPTTIRARSFFNKYFAKLQSGSNGSYVDWSTKNNIIIQMKINGPVIKTYGTIISKDFIGFREGDYQKITVPQDITELSVKILRDHNLVIGGLDWMIEDGRWYLIDLNATAGFNNIPLCFAKDVIREGLKILTPRVLDTSRCELRGNIEN